MDPAPTRAGEGPRGGPLGDSRLEFLTRALGHELSLPAGRVREVAPMARAGESLRLQQIRELDSGGRLVRTWVAKGLNPRLLREREAYLGPLRGAGLAPELAVTCTDPQGIAWLVLEDGGETLTADSLAEHAVACASLVARIHGHAWRPGRRGFRLRPVHVEHGRRHVKGEWSIARGRVKKAVGAGALPAEVLPGKAEAARVFDRALSGLAVVPSGFLHGDLQPANLLRSAGGGVLAIDWSQWGIGSPVWDLAGLTLDLAPHHREAFLHAYLIASRQENTASWDNALDRVLPMRHFLGLGVLADHALKGDPVSFVARGLSRRLEAWQRAREGVSA